MADVNDAAPEWVGRVAAFDWAAQETSLATQGWSVLSGLLTLAECRALAERYAVDACFRSRVVMAKHNFGRGEYRYFAYPLPQPIAALRAALYPRLARLASRWVANGQADVTFPATHAEYLAHCHAAGQTRPTPLLLHYVAGDYNCLHQDLYGDEVFPLQVAILLSQPGEDFTGGEFVLTEQRPRMQSRAQVVPWRQGDALIFAVSQRPVQGTRGTYRVNLRHGVSTVLSGERYVAGIIFHDAR